MSTLLKHTEPIARKNYSCDASHFISNMGNLRGYTFTFSEWRAIINARDNNWQIEKGEKYIRQSIVDFGDFYDFKAITKMHEICLKYGYYED